MYSILPSPRQEREDLIRLMILNTVFFGNRWSSRSQHHFQAGRNTLEGTCVRQTDNRRSCTWRCAGEHKHPCHSKWLITTQDRLWKVNSPASHRIDPLYPPTSFTPAHRPPTPLLGVFTMYNHSNTPSGSLVLWFSKACYENLHEAVLLPLVPHGHCG